MTNRTVEQCDERCHEDNLDTCDRCDTGDWRLMCDSCRYYGAQDAEPGCEVTA